MSAEARGKCSSGDLYEGFASVRRPPKPRRTAS